VSHKSESCSKLSCSEGILESNEMILWYQDVAQSENLRHPHPQFISIHLIHLNSSQFISIHLNSSNSSQFI
jgi:hypothetical protein